VYPLFRMAGEWEVIYPFEDPEVLSLCVGQVVHVLEITGEWAHVQAGTDVGYFPLSYLKAKPKILENDVTNMADEVEKMLASLGPITLPDSHLGDTSGVLDDFLKSLDLQGTPQPIGEFPKSTPDVISPTSTKDLNSLDDLPPFKPLSPLKISLSDGNLPLYEPLSPSTSPRDSNHEPTQLTNVSFFDPIPSFEPTLSIDILSPSEFDNSMPVYKPLSPPTSNTQRDFVPDLSTNSPKPEPITRQMPARDPLPQKKSITPSISGSLQVTDLPKFEPISDPPLQISNLLLQMVTRKIPFFETQSNQIELSDLKQLYNCQGLWREGTIQVISRVHLGCTPSFMRELSPFKEG
jgi:hypothetical protein